MEEGLAESGRLVCTVARAGPALLQAEEVEVADEEGGPVGNGRHCHMSRASAAVAASSNVVRSTDRGTNRVHQRLKPGRAMTLC
jgi:hypothetical protein